MINIKLTGFITEPDSKRTTDKGKGWVVTRSLKLYFVDGKEGHPDVAEWFYVFACNQHYYSTSAVKDRNGIGYYIQDEFDEEALLKAVELKFNKLSFDNWDDFYAKMQTISDWEDADRFNYNRILDFFSNNLSDKEFRIVENDEVLRINIKINKYIMHIIIQGLDVPEIDIKFGKVERYLSAGSTTDMLSYLETLLKDIKMVLKHKDDLHFSRTKFFVISTRHWYIDIPEKLKIL